MLIENEASNILEAGGKPSTWFPPEGFRKNMFWHKTYFSKSLKSFSGSEYFQKIQVPPVRSLSIFVTEKRYSFKRRSKIYSFFHFEFYQIVQISLLLTFFPKFSFWIVGHHFSVISFFRDQKSMLFDIKKLTFIVSIDFEIFENF